MSSKAIVWIREDFRIHHNQALSYAARNHDQVTALYIYNPKNFIGKREAQQWWLSKSLQSFDDDLSKLNINLEIQSGNEIDVLSNIKKLKSQNKKIIGFGAPAKATTSLNYLKNQIAKAQLIEIRQSVFNLIQEQIKIITLAEGREEYLLRTLFDIRDKYLEGRNITVLDDSPFKEFIINSFGLTVFEYELKEVVRQAKSSGILYNSFQIRNQQNLNIDNKTESLKYPKLYSSEFDDVVRINGRELQDELENMNGRFGIQGCMVVTRSNKRANNFNQQIRSRILWHEDEICTGDLLMVVKNNYFWLSADSEAGFIANGDSIEILNIRGYEELYGKRFANVICRMIDYPNQPDLELKILLDTLMIDGPNLPAKEMKQFFEAVEEDYMEFSNRKQRIKKVLENPYFNALQVKFAYAVTCHKAQGGQWPAVFIDQGYLTDTMMNNEYLRWLYTAITRAQKIVYLVNFIDKFFPEEQSETF